MKTCSDCGAKHDRARTSLCASCSAIRRRAYKTEHCRRRRAAGLKPETRRYEGRAGSQVEKGRRAAARRDEIRALYRGGLGVLSIAARLGLSRSLVVRELECARVDERPGREFRGDGWGDGGGDQRFGLVNDGRCG